MDSCIREINNLNVLRFKEKLFEEFQYLDLYKNHSIMRLKSIINILKVIENKYHCLDYNFDNELKSIIDLKCLDLMHESEKILYKKIRKPWDKVKLELNREIYFLSKEIF